MFDLFKKKTTPFERVFQVRPNQVGCLFKNNVLAQKLEAGTYRFEDDKGEYTLLPIDTTLRFLLINNQEVLSKDNVALRFSYFLSYRVGKLENLLDNFSLEFGLMHSTASQLFMQVEAHLTYITHTHIRKIISSIQSEELNEKREEITDFKTESMVQEADSFGITLENAQIRDLTFPKNIQDLFNKQLEAKIRSKTDLENARTAVATARALKNASDIIKEDENVRYMQFLETLHKIASKGNHTFVLGNQNELWKKKP
jgi:regulator of protease activity HflC (stomatin/prohibitin superfamily)